MPIKSAIWDHFEPCDNSTKEAKCIHCTKRLSTEQGSTKGSWDHLECLHSKQFKKVKEDEMDAKKKKVEYDENRKSVYKLNDESAEAAPSQFSSKTSPSNSQSYSSYIQKFCAPARQVPQVDRLIFTWLADGMLPYTTIDNPYFRLLIETVNNLQYKYALPHEGKIRLSVGPKVIEAVEWKIRQILNDEVESYCFDTDMWMSPAQTSYLSFVIHFVDSKWCRKMSVVKCKPVYTKHMSENINLEMEEIRNEEDLPREKLHLAVRDSAANMVLAMHIGEVDDVNCYLHLLNLIVTKGILDQ